MSSSTGLLILLGAGAGFTSGMLGIGGGVIYVPALMFVAGVPIHVAIGVSLAVIVPSAAAGAMKHFADGNFDTTMVLVIAPMSIVGALLGAYVSTAVPAVILKKAFGVCLIVIGANTVFGLSDKMVGESGEHASTEFSELIADYHPGTSPKDEAGEEVAQEPKNASSSKVAASEDHASLM